MIASSQVRASCGGEAPLGTGEDSLKEIVIDPVLRFMGAIDRRRGAYAAGGWTVIVAVYDQPDATAMCLESVARHAPDCELVIVDDASRDSRTAEVIAGHAARYPCVNVRNDVAKGHTESNRLGVSSSSRPFLCLLNSDAALTRNSLRLMLPILERNDVGCVGPTTSYAATSQAAHPYARWRKAVWSSLEVDGFGAYCYHRYKSRKPLELPYVAGFALCIARSTWNVSGGFDVGLPDYGNEKELCLRLGRLGRTNLWVRGSYVHHIGNLSYGTLGQQEVDLRRRRGDTYISRKNGSSE